MLRNISICFYLRVCCMMSVMLHSLILVKLFIWKIKRILYGGQLETEIDNQCFNNDSKGRPVGFPHEIMSALVSMKFFPSLFANGDEKAFFARCIVGLKYTGTSNAPLLMNISIEVLEKRVSGRPSLNIRFFFEQNQ